MRIYGGNKTDRTNTFEISVQLEIVLISEQIFNETQILLKISLFQRFPTIPEKSFSRFPPLSATACKPSLWLSQKPIFSFQAARPKHKHALRRKIKTSTGNLNKTSTHPHHLQLPLSNREPKRNHPQWGWCSLFSSLEKQKSYRNLTWVSLRLNLWNGLRPQNQFVPATNANDTTERNPWRKTALGRTLALWWWCGIFWEGLQEAGVAILEAGCFSNLMRTARDEYDFDLTGIMFGKGILTMVVYLCLEKEIQEFFMTRSAITYSFLVC